MPMSDAQKKATAKYAKDNYQHISFKARLGSRDRIKEAADASGLSVNRFIKEAISAAMMKKIGKPLEPTDNEAAKLLLLRIMDDEIQAAMVSYAIIPNLFGKVRSAVESKVLESIESNPSICEEYAQIIASDLSPKAKGKALREYENLHRDVIGEIVSEHVEDLRPCGSYMDVIKQLKK